jgi:hypothetical protein
MSKKVGKLASVKYCGAKVAGMGTWNLSGVTRDVLEDTEFGDDVKTFLFNMADGGTVDFTGLYDPDDSTGQVALNALQIAGTVLSGTSLQFFIDSTSYWAISTGGSILITKASAVSYDKNGLGQCSFSAKISGTMYLA